jgi:hypothetical protein
VFPEQKQQTCPRMLRSRIIRNAGIFSVTALLGCFPSRPDCTALKSPGWIEAAYSITREND